MTSATGGGGSLGRSSGTILRHVRATAQSARAPPLHLALNHALADLRVGESYRLNTGTKLTLPETKPELRSRARARVRFETGIKRGEVTDLACQRIVEP
jgi:hypothetical protein